MPPFELGSFITAKFFTKPDFFHYAIPITQNSARVTRDGIGFVSRRSPKSEDGPVASKLFSEDGPVSSKLFSEDGLALFRIPVISRWSLVLSSRMGFSPAIRCPRGNAVLRLALFRGEARRTKTDLSRRSFSAKTDVSHFFPFHS